MAVSASIPASFARQAAEWLREGEVGRAVGLCVAGTREYPDYATGHFVLGRCYEALGRTDDALAEYRRALESLPDNPAILDHIARLKERSAKARAEASRAAEQQNVQRTTRSVRDALPEQQRRDDATAFDILARRLEEERRRRMSQAAPAEDTSSAGSAEHRDAHSADMKDIGFATPTLAEIYARQGAYTEALEAYRRLAERDPQNPSYAARIRELEVLVAQAQEGKKKAP